MSCAANGQMFRIDSSERLARLLGRLNTGEPANVPTLDPGRRRLPACIS